MYSYFQDCALFIRDFPRILTKMLLRGSSMDLPSCLCTDQRRKSPGEQPNTSSLKASHCIEKASMHLFLFSFFQLSEHVQSPLCGYSHNMRSGDEPWIQDFFLALIFGKLLKIRIQQMQKSSAGKILANYQPKAVKTEFWRE